MAQQPLNNFNNLAMKGQFNYQHRPTQYFGRTQPQHLLDLTKSNNTARPEVKQVATRPVPAPLSQVQKPIDATHDEFDPETQQILAQQFSIPIYLNNYSGEYEDTKYRRFSLHAVRITKKLILGTSLALALILAGTAMILLDGNNKNIVNAQSSKSGISSNNNNQSYASSIEPTSSQVANYTVGANSLRYLIIPKLNVQSMITPVSLNGNNLDAPDNIFNVGWWKDSSLPGQTGPVILDGFTSNGASDGVFGSLSKLKTGDTFQVEMGNSSKINYQIVKISNFSGGNTNMEEAISPANQGTSSLNIITCSGHTTTCPGSSSDNVIFAQQH